MSILNSGGWDSKQVLQSHADVNGLSWQLEGWGNKCFVQRAKQGLATNRAS
jgi:hypothetical protein